MKERTIVIVDWGNVERWETNLRWKVGIHDLAKLVKHFAFGKQHLRRLQGRNCFYWVCADHGMVFYHLRAKRFEHRPAPAGSR
jgi:hypothetical protein